MAVPSPPGEVTESGVRSRLVPFVDADVAELADATDLGSVALWGVEVQILSSALMGPWPSGMAPALHAGDRRFESGRVHQEFTLLRGEGSD